MPINLNEYIEIEDSSIKLNKKELNKRAKLDTGKFCNRSCNFCYYYNDLKTKDFLSPINAGILTGYLLDKGIREIELSGGEPTANPKIKEIVQEIKKEFQKRNLEPLISIVTNGSLSDELFLELQEDIKEWLFSIHGTRDVHDIVVGKKDSLQKIFNKMLLNLNDTLGLLFRVNFVVTTYQEDTKTICNLDEYSMDMLNLFLNEGIQVNLLPLNYWKDAVKNDSNTELIYDSINKFIDEFVSKNSKQISDYKLNDKLRSNLLNIRYPQYCLLSDNARKFAVGHLDHIYDLHDWNKLYYPKDINPKEMKLSTNGIDPLVIYTEKDLTLDNILETVKKDRILSHNKDIICKKCIYVNSCDGIKIGDTDNKEKRKIFVKRINNET